MKYMVAGQTVFDANEFTELALGVVPELFAGIPGESEMERAARMDAAHDVLADLESEDPELAAYALILLRQAPVPLRRPTVVRRRNGRAGVAA